MSRWGALAVRIQKSSWRESGRSSSLMKSLCEICGCPGHMPELSSTGKKWVFGSDCDFSTHTLNAKKLQMIECSLPVKNYPMECGICKEYIWRYQYDMQKHFEKKHPGKEFPPDGIVSAEEKEILRKKKEEFKKQSSDLGSEQAHGWCIENSPIKGLLGRKKNKKWKQHDYGIFGKQQTARMKRLFGENNFQ